MEQTLVETALGITEIDTNLFSSTPGSLWKPIRGRGVFGGQVVGQALMAATRTVASSFTVHSLHSYFLLPGDFTVPIIYFVERVRNGTSFATRTVTAKQRGRAIFVCTVSFQVPDKLPILDHQTPMPEQVPPPESLPDIHTQAREWMEMPNLSPTFKKYLEFRLTEPLSIDMRVTPPYTPRDMFHPEKGQARRLMWMKANGSLESDNHMLHQCVVAYSSDFQLLPVSLIPHGVNSVTKPIQLSMIASLDHSIWFHAPFRADEWLLYVMESPRLHQGRGLTFGRIYTRDGTLVVTVAQEGVIRVKDLRLTPKL
jgi:acyl-CoA thioesterase II